MTTIGVREYGLCGLDGGCGIRLWGRWRGGWLCGGGLGGRLLWWKLFRWRRVVEVERRRWGVLMRAVRGLECEIGGRYGFLGEVDAGRRDVDHCIGRAGDRVTEAESNER